MVFRKAERKQAKVRVGLSGPSGSGKTFSALLMAFGLGKKIAVIDTENGSGDLYAHLGDYDICQIKAPFDPKKYIDAIKAAEQAGYEVIIVDSLTHAWAGDGGLLDQQGKIADSGKGNSYTAWRTITPKHNQLVESMLQSPCHIIATTRAKVEYVIEKNSNGKDVPKKVGLAPVQREGMEYEFTVFFDISHEHIASASKDRTSLFDGQYFKPSTETGKQLLAWFESGAEVPLEAPSASEPEEKDGPTYQAVIDKIGACRAMPRLKNVWDKYHKLYPDKLSALTALKDKQKKTIERLNIDCAKSGGNCPHALKDGTGSATGCGITMMDCDHQKEVA